MCLISVGPLPEERVLEDAAMTNSDGIGVAWVTKQGIRYRKGLSVKDLMKLPDAVKQACAVHFRLATAGGDKAELMHPFPVHPDVPLHDNGIADRVIMHNGHVFGWEDMAKGVGSPKKGPMSDSRLIAFYVWRYGHKILHLFRGNRILYISKKRTLMYGDWHKDENDGVTRWYSNQSFRYQSRGCYSGYDRTGEDYDTGWWDKTGGRRSAKVGLTTEEWKNLMTTEEIGELDDKYENAKIDEMVERALDSKYSLVRGH